MHEVEISDENIKENAIRSLFSPYRVPGRHCDRGRRPPETAVRWVFKERVDAHDKSLRQRKTPEVRCKSHGEKRSGLK